MNLSPLEVDDESSLIDNIWIVPMYTLYEKNESPEADTLSFINVYCLKYTVHTQCHLQNINLHTMPKFFPV